MSIKKGRVAIVTGAGQGIGACIAKRLAAEGAYVAVCDVNEANAKAVAQEILDEGNTAAAIAADVGSKADCVRIVEEVMAKWGFLDILVNNAAVMDAAPLKVMTEEQWDNVIRVNLKGPFLMTQAVSTVLCEQGFGRVINISDDMCRGDVGQANYAASKAGLDALTHTAALELGKHGVCVNSVCVGFMDRPMAEDLVEKFQVRVEKYVPAKKTGSAADVAEAVYFFASEETGYINGQILAVNGGMQVGFKGLQ